MRRDRASKLLLVTLGFAALMLFRERLWAYSLFTSAVLARPMSVLGCRAHVGELAERVAQLPLATRERCRAIYRVTVRESVMVISPSFAPKMVRWTIRDGQSEADALQSARRQTAVVVTELVHGHEAHFNPLRASKPVAFKHAEGASPAFDEIASSAGPTCDFCSPAEQTGAESWGRIEGRSSLTAANAFRADGVHGLLVFARHDPLTITLDELADGLDVIERWLRRSEAEARTRAPASGAWWPLVWWNGLHRSSASQIHAHAQMVLSPTPPGRTSAYARAQAGYSSARGSDFFADLAAVHVGLGLGVRVGAAHVLASLTPHVPALARVRSQGSRPCLLARTSSARGSALCLQFLHTCR